MQIKNIKLALIENEKFEESRVVLSDSADEIIKEESETEIIQILEDETEEKLDSNGMIDTNMITHVLKWQ